jgi:WD40 repeat protein
MNVVRYTNPIRTSFAILTLAATLPACAAQIDDPEGPQAELSSEALSQGLTVRWSINNASGPVAFSPDGTTLATGSSTDVVQTLATSDGHQLKTFRVRGTATGASFSPDGSELLEGSSSGPLNLRLYRIADGSQVFSEKVAYNNGVTAVAFSPTDATLFVTAGHEKNTPNTTVWNTSGTVVRSLQDGHRVLAMDMARDGQRVASNASGTLDIWRIADGALLLKIASANQFAVAFSPDGRYVSTGVELFDASTGALVRKFPVGGGVDAVTFTKDGSALVTGGEDTVNGADAAVIRYFRVSDGTQLVQQAFPGTSTYVNHLAISPDGKSLAYSILHAGVTGLAASPF